MTLRNKGGLLLKDNIREGEYEIYIDEKYSGGKTNMIPELIKQMKDREISEASPGSWLGQSVVFDNFAHMNSTCL